MVNNAHQILLAIDPGRDKCGLAVLDASGKVLAKLVCPAPELKKCLDSLCAEHKPNRIAIGDGTGSDEVVKVVESATSLKASVVPERGTTLEARELAWRENPPSGIWRILPRLFWPTPRDLDAWSAVVIGRRALVKFP